MLYRVGLRGTTFEREIEAPNAQEARFKLAKMEKMPVTDYIYIKRNDTIAVYKVY